MNVDVLKKNLHDVIERYRNKEEFTGEVCRDVMARDCLQVVEELEAENERLKGELEHARSYKHTIKMRNRNLHTENERLKAENLKHREDKITMALKYNEVLNYLNYENEKLKCLALHLFSKYFFDCYWNSEGPDSIRYLHLSQKYEKAYRKTKKKLQRKIANRDF